MVINNSIRIDFFSYFKNMIKIVFYLLLGTALSLSYYLLFDENKKSKDSEIIANRIQLLAMIILIYPILIIYLIFKNK